MQYYTYPGPYMVPGAPQDALGQLRAAQGYQIPGPAQMPATGQQIAAQAVNDGGIIWVQGEAGAKAYMVAPGASVLLMDSEGSSFYIKSADASGMPMPLRAFDFVERTSTAQAAIVGPLAAVHPPEGNYTTRDETAALAARIAALEALQQAPASAPSKRLEPITEKE